MILTPLYKPMARDYAHSMWQICSGWDGQDRMHLNRPRIHANAFNKKKRLGFTFVGLLGRVKQCSGGVVGPTVGEWFLINGYNRYIIV